MPRTRSKAGYGATSVGAMSEPRESNDVRFMVDAGDLFAARKFWEGRLGFAIAKTFPGGMMIDLGTAILEIFATADPQPNPARLSIEVTDLDELWADWSEAPEVGHALRTNRWGDRSFSVFDPNGIEVILFQPL